MSDCEAREAAEARARGRLDAEDYDLENVDEWEPMGSSYQTGSFGFKSASASGRTGRATWEFEPEDFDDRTAVVWYNADGLRVILEAAGPEARSGFSAGLDAEQAKEFAAAIYQAAIEHEARLEAENGGQ